MFGKFVLDQLDLFVVDVRINDFKGLGSSAVDQDGNRFVVGFNCFLCVRILFCNNSRLITNAELARSFSS